MEYEYPYVSDRYKSMFIDSLVIVGLMVVFSIILGLFDNVPEGVRIGLFASLFLYEPVCISLGNTVGNYVMKIRARKSSDPTKKLNIFQSIVRFAFKAGLGFISLLIVHANPQRKAIHDFLSGSVMVKVRDDGSIQEAINSNEEQENVMDI